MIGTPWVLNKETKMSTDQIDRIVIALTEMKSAELAYLARTLASVDTLTTAVLRNALQAEIGVA